MEDCSVSTFNFTAPTCRSNTFRLLRAMQIEKPVLLEGPPGVGKSSLIQELARAAGHKLTRLNYSDQTDLSDLFGTDLPVVLKKGKQGFLWNDGPLLTAMKEGHWILMDEVGTVWEKLGGSLMSKRVHLYFTQMNLASQSVLEGLNACFDHRGEIFVSELGKTFKVERRKTKFFACQNPFRGGGDRRGLPKSFLNRFSAVYLDELTSEDEMTILKSVAAGKLSDSEISSAVALNRQINDCVNKKKAFGQTGAPWEFNLRDLLRWVDLCSKRQNNCPDDPFLILYRNRMRTNSDREKMNELFSGVYGREVLEVPKTFWLTEEFFQVGGAVIKRDNGECPEVYSLGPVRLLKSQLPYLETLTHCVLMNWLAILVGGSAVGKSTLVKMLAVLCRKELRIFNVTSETDAVELLGSFEQTSAVHKLKWEIIQFCDCVQWNGTEVLSKVSLLSQRLQSATHFDDIAHCLEELKTCVPKESESDVESMKERVKEESSSLRFEWIDSPLLEAYRDGKWLLLENVNCCSPAVLDRLNAALEPNGRLTVPERGLKDGRATEYRAHPHFRVFFTMNPKYGSISRAMRNRGVEIALLEDSSWYRNEEDFQDVLRQFSLAEESLADLFRASDSASAPGYASLEAGYKTAALASEDNAKEIREMWSECFGKELSASESGECTLNKDFIESLMVDKLISDPASILGHLQSEAWMFASSSSGSCGFLQGAKHLIISSTKPDFFSRIQLIESVLSRRCSRALQALGEEIVETGKELGITWDPRYFGPVWNLFYSIRNVSRKKKRDLISKCNK